MISTVLFDLDGTISDSAPGIIASLRRAFADNGLPPLDAAAERLVVGPPFREVLPPFLGDVPLAAVRASYLEHYQERGGMLVTRAYDGVADLLLALRDRGVRMAVATSKPESSAVPIVDHLGLIAFFETIGGDTGDGSRGNKALVVGEVLERLGRPAPAEVMMIGDRSHDVVGAAAHGIACLGAGWGYGLPGELASAGAAEIFATAEELRRALPRLLAPRVGEGLR